MSEVNSLQFDTSFGFVEVKTTLQEGNNQAISNDIARLCMLCKNAIDKWSIRGCISIQVIDKGV
jgi:hypothetical protein